MRSLGKYRWFLHYFAIFYFGTNTLRHSVIHEAQVFYRQLYSPDTIDDAAVNSLLNNLPPDTFLTTNQANSLTEKPNLATIDSLISHTPTGKSPGLDGIPFEVYR